MNDDWIADPKGDLEACLRRAQQGVQLREAMLGRSEDGIRFAKPLLGAVDTFERQSIPYALVGEAAAVFYGVSRFVGQFDFVALGNVADTLLDERVVVLRNDHADEIVRSAREVEVGGRRVRVAEQHDLVAMMLRVGRIADDYYVSEIVKAGAINDQQVEGRVSAEQFAHYLEIKRRTR